jgi:hypothetical protein
MEGALLLQEEVFSTFCHFIFTVCKNRRLATFTSSHTLTDPLEQYAVKSDSNICIWATNQLGSDQFEGDDISTLLLCTITSHMTQSNNSVNAVRFSPYVS